ncbi:MAG: hypothetical protein ACR2KP_12035 [Egibacteraceae bacterium]
MACRRASCWPARTSGGKAWLADHNLQLRRGELRPLDPRATYSLRRGIAPQLRRWAAATTVHRPADVAGVLARAKQLDSRHGAAPLLGLLDASEGLDNATGAGVLDIAVGWPAPSVRLPAPATRPTWSVGRLDARARSPRSWAQDQGLKPSETDYVARTRNRRSLQFSRSGEPAIEQAYRTHWVSPQLSERKRERLADRASKPPDLLVIAPP